MVPDRQEAKGSLKKGVVCDNWCRRIGDMYKVQVQPASEERNEWKGWKEKKRDERNNYHHTE